MPPPKAFIVLPKSISSAKSKEKAASVQEKNVVVYGKGKKPFYTKPPKPLPPAKLWWQEDVLKNNSTKPLISPESPWYNQYGDFLLKQVDNNNQQSSSHNSHFLDVKQLTIFKEKVKAFYQLELTLYKNNANGNTSSNNNNNNSDEKWLESVIKAGTWSDKIAAMALKIQESPFHHLEALDLLLGIAIKKDLRTAGMAVEALKDLFLNNLLPDDRPLMTLAHFPVLHPDCTPKYALLAWFENELKIRYGQLIEVVQKALQANLVYFRKQGLATTYDLLAGKPEQEKLLLEILVNKLGDPEGTVMSKASEILRQLVSKHPAMKIVLICEVRHFIQRALSKIPLLFAAINFLNSINLHEKDEDRVAQLLAECYLSLFETALEAKEKGSRLLAALLKGINKVFPKIVELGDLIKYIDTIFRLAHTAQSQAASTQALVLLSHIAFQESSNTTNKTRSNKAMDSVANRFYQAMYSRVFADQILKQSNNSDFLNLLFRSIKRDPQPRRAMAFLKRILMAAIHTPSPLSAGLLLIVSEVLSERKDLLDAIRLGDSVATTEKPSSDHNDNHGNDEVNGDDQDSIEDDVVGGGDAAGGTGSGGSEGSTFGVFDAEKRNPLFACVADGVPALFELSLLRRHFHPSVRAFASALLEPPAHGIAFKGDPLEEFSLSNFLDQFAYKHPKQQVKDRLSQPINQQFSEGVEGSMEVEQVAPDKRFFFKYFGDRSTLLAEGKMRQRKKANQTEEGNESENGEDTEDEADAFADDLARKLAKSSSHNDGDDGEDWEEGLNEEDEVADDDSDGVVNEDWDEGVDDMNFEDFKRSQGGKKRNRGESDEEEDDLPPQAYVSDDEDDVDFDMSEEDEEPAPKSKKTKKNDTPKGKKSRMEDDFAAAEDFEEEMEANVRAHSLEQLEQEEAAKAMGQKKFPKKMNKKVSAKKRKN
eukprot:gene178-187_t